MPNSRMRRVNEVVREVVGTTIADDLHDPRIGFVTVTAVETSPDLRTARVHFSVLGSDRERDETLEALEASRKVIQKALGTQLSMKRTPKLSFHYDDSVERAARLTEMLEDRPR